MISLRDDLIPFTKSPIALFMYAISSLPSDDMLTVKSPPDIFSILSVRLVTGFLISFLRTMFIITITATTAITATSIRIITSLNSVAKTSLCLA